jgi:ubiquinone/menaquinone biosynthesis C-methylase UbiE
MPMKTSGAGYPLRSGPAELEWLNRTGRILAAATRTILETGGIRSGMRVLDLGSGTGEVAFVAAGLVGASGEVVGIDRSPDAIAMAEARARQQGLGNVTFVEGDIHDAVGGGPFDAVVGRLVLMYVPDPSAVLRTQATVLRSSAVAVPIELDLPTARGIPETPLVGQVLSWIAACFERSGIHPSLGPRLWTTLREAGFRPLGMMGIQPHFGPEDPDGPALLAGIVRAALPLIERTGVAQAQEVMVETLEARLADELRARGAVFAFPNLLSAWGTLSRGNTVPAEVLG